MSNLKHVNPLEDNKSEPAFQLVSFSIKDELFCLDILKVQEIIRVQEITPVPHTPDFVEGVITLRGKIVPVIDLCDRFRMGRSDHSESTRIIVTNVKHILLGMVVDAVHEVVNLPASAISMASTIGNEMNDYVLGVGKLQGRLVTLVDVNAIGTPLGHTAEAA